MDQIDAIFISGDQHPGALTEEEEDRSLLDRSLTCSEGFHSSPERPLSKSARRGQDKQTPTGVFEASAWCVT